MGKEINLKLSKREVEQILSGLKIRVTETQDLEKENNGSAHYIDKEVGRQRRIQEGLIMKLRHELKRLSGPPEATNKV